MGTDDPGIVALPVSRTPLRCEVEGVEVLRPLAAWCPSCEKYLNPPFPVGHRICSNCYAPAEPKPFDGQTVDVSIRVAVRSVPCGSPDPDRFVENVVGMMEKKGGTP